MAQTPVSASVEVLQGTTTLYTVPTGKTAVVKGVIGGSVVGNTSATYTINKVSGGNTYPITTLQNPYQTPATGGTAVANNNLLQAPVTLVAGESITVYTGAANAIQIPNIASYTNNTGTTIYISQIVFDNNIFIAVGYYNTNVGLILRSTDGISWTQISAPTLSRINTVAYGNSYWVAAPKDGYDQGKIYYSADNGLTWSSVTVASGQNCKAVSFGNSTWVSLWGNLRLYTASTPTTWSLNSNFSSYVYSSTNGYISCAVWNGTNWIFTGEYSNLVYSPDLSTYTSIGGPNFGQNAIGTDVGSISYSSAYSKWYATYAKNGTRGIYESTNGRVWTNLTTPSFNNLYGVETAGSNTVLIACGVNNSSTGANSPYLRSTDGVNWTQNADSRSYTGPLIGLDNGYFVKYQNNSTSPYYITTDPVSSTGTINTASVSSFTPLNLGAASPSGKWMTLGYSSASSTIYTGGGSSGININSHNNTTVDYPTYGYPASITYNATDGNFYWITTLGYLFYQSTYNSGSTYVTQVFGGSGYYSIKYFQGYLYVTCSNGSQLNLVAISSSNNYGAFTSYTISSNQINPYIGEQTQYGTSYQFRKFASSSTKLVALNQRGCTFITDSTNPLTFAFEPNGVQHYQRINNTDVLYGGTTSVGEQLYGLYQSSDITTTPTTKYLTDLYFGSAGSDVYNKNSYMAYSNSNYYIMASSNAMYSGATLPQLVNTSVSTTSVNGESWAYVSSSSELNVSGSNFYTFTSQVIYATGTLNVGKTTNIASAINNSYMTGSIVQID